MHLAALGRPPEGYQAGKADSDDDDSESDTAEGDQRGGPSAASRLVDHLRFRGEPVRLEKHSVYGALVLLPQLARSTGWHWVLVMITFKVYTLYIVSTLLQLLLILEISREQNMFDLFAGQMWLCDFGAPILNCPESPSCQGPSGTQITATRLYDFRTWMTRRFVQQSLRAVLPDRAADIDRLVDPGEYGAESRVSRWMACFVFMIGISDELVQIFNMGKVLYYTPNAAESWIRDAPRREPGEAAKVSQSGEASHDSLLDSVEIELAGIPVSWKVFYFIVAFVPRVLVWKLTVESGITFLMETQDIGDCIVNALALTFISHIDTMIIQTDASRSASILMERCGDLSLSESAFGVRQLSVWQTLRMLVPTDLALAGWLCTVGVWSYYYQHCEWSAEGDWFYSKDTYSPNTTDFPLLHTLFPSLFNIPVREAPFWQMPRSQRAER